MIDYCGYKMVALKLACLSLSDQRWILSRLPNGDRDRVVFELDMLKKLGITNNADLLEQAMLLPVRPSLISALQKVSSIKFGKSAELYLQEAKSE